MPARLHLLLRGLLTELSAYRRTHERARRAGRAFDNKRSAICSFHSLESFSASIRTKSAPEGKWTRHISRTRAFRSILPALGKERKTVDFHPVCHRDTAAQIAFSTMQCAPIAFLTKPQQRRMALTKPSCGSACALVWVCRRVVRGQEAWARQGCKVLPNDHSMLSQCYPNAISMLSRCYLRAHGRLRWDENTVPPLIRR